MENTGNDGANKPLVGDDIGEKSRGYEDEINLVDYLFILWKHKWLILVCSVLPALIVGVCIHLSPSSYVVTYTYDVRGDVKGDVRDDVGGDVSNWNLNEKYFNVLQSRFYSEDNLNRITGKLEQNKLDESAEHIKTFRSGTSSWSVNFEVSPPFPDLSKLNAIDPGQIEKFRDMKASLLNMTITGRSKEYIGKIALAIRDNFEEVTPLYLILEQLSTDIRGYNSNLANIESSRFGLDLDLKNYIEMLAGLKKVEVAALGEKRGEIVLQFDVGDQLQYLPLTYQVQAMESKVLELEGQITKNATNYKYYEDLSGLSAQMVAELNDKLHSGENYTIELFNSFLADLIGEIEQQELKDYLASYIKKLENRISVSAPVLQTPKITSVAKDASRKSALAFIVALACSVFLAFLIESVQKHKD